MTVLRGAGPVGPGAPVEAPGAGYDTRWLDLRAAADSRSRSVELLRRLLVAARDGGPDGGGAGRTVTAAAPLHLLDLGCGTGSMQRWCAGQVPAGTRWTLLDPDPGLLQVAVARADGEVQRRTARVGDLTVDAFADVDAVVCSALLDVLPATDVDHLVAVLAAARVPLLAALTVTGRVHLDPPNPDDGRAGDAVHDTAGSAGAAGERALPLLAAAATRSGAVVVSRPTAWWLLPGRDDALLQAWADGYVAAALAGAAGGTAPAGPADLQGWAAARACAVRAGALQVMVEHVDVLVLPGAASGDGGPR